MTYPTSRLYRAARNAIAVSAAVALIAACGGDDDESAASQSAEETQASGNTSGTATDASTAGATEPPTVTGTNASQTDSAPGTDSAADAEPTDLQMGQGVSDSEIKIGIIIDDSGPFGSFSPGLRATIDAKVSLINDTGGIAGRDVKIVYYDSKSDPAQGLILTKRLWEEDKVLTIYDIDLNGPPVDYVTDNAIPAWVTGGGTAPFSSKYPTLIPVGGSLPAWNAQSAYAAVTYQDKHPKNVAVSIFPYEEPLKFWIEDYWKALGAENVTIDVGVDPTGDCSALVLKYQTEEIDFWDFHDNSFLACIPAQVNAGWSPPMGQGGPSTSTIANASLVGKPMADLEVLAGAPTTRYDGKPVHETIPPENQEYVDAMKKYAPDYSSERWLNDPMGMPQGWGTMTLIEYALRETAKTGELSPESLNAWTASAKDVPVFASNPIRSLGGDCKTGTDSTIWGTWKWDEAKQELFMEPFAPLVGEPLISNEWFDDDPCYLTKLADEYYVD